MGWFTFMCSVFLLPLFSLFHKFCGDIEAENVATRQQRQWMRRQGCKNGCNVVKFDFKIWLVKNLFESLDVF